MKEIILRKSDEIAKVMGTLGDLRDRRPLLCELQQLREHLDERIIALRRKVA